jgi:hypothetical protein
MDLMDRIGEAKGFGPWAVCVLVDEPEGAAEA